LQGAAWLRQRFPLEDNLSSYNDCLCALARWAEEERLEGALLGNATKRPATKRRPRSPTGALTPERIIRTAFDFIDRHGVDTLTLRAIAEELGCVHTALFWHFRTRDDLLRAVLRFFMAEMASDIPTTGSWDDRGKIICRGIRRRLHQHPTVLTLARLYPPREISPFAPALTQIAEEAGYHGLEAVAAARMLLELVGGFSPSTGAPDEIEARLPLGSVDTPLAIEHLEFVIAYSKVDADSIFEAALEGAMEVLRRQTPILKPPP
jgi:AcrR family transcriptional regulator